MSFANTLKYLREEKQVTQKSLAAACNLSAQCICALEQGTRYPTGSTLIAIARFFDVTTDYLLGLEDDFGNRVPAETVDAMRGTATGAAGLSSEERKIIEQYRQLPEKLRKLVREQLEIFTAPSEIVSKPPKKV